MTFREALTSGEQILTLAKVQDPKTDAWIILSMVCHIDRTFYYMHSEEDMSEDQKREFEMVIRKRSERVPLQYILGEQEFMGLTFKVNSNVLVPRQDTETLVEEALKVVKPGMRVLDLCTGSGCILLSVMSKCDGIIGTASDISKQALAVAKENARSLGIIAEFEHSNLFEKLSGSFDVILSNPPYIPTSVIPTLMPEVSTFEPIEALDGHEDGLYFYRRIVEEAGKYLNPEGYLLFEIGNDQGKDVSEMLWFAGFKDVKVIKDLAGNDRVVAGHL